MNLANSVNAKSIAQYLKLVATALLVIASALSVGSAGASENTEAFVRGLVDESYRILDDETLSEIERCDRFHALLSSASDLRRTAAFTLGSYLHNAERPVVERFVQVFEGLVVRTVQMHLEELSDHDLIVTGSTDRSDDDSIVAIQVVDPNGNRKTKAQGAFRVRTNEGGKFVITDIQIEGIWLAINDRADFTSYLRRNAGDISKLSDQLEKQTRDIPKTVKGMG